ncbi:MAG: hypothetical protein ACRDZ3_20610 [Acidimicrobiia bacterium]
MSTHSLMFQVTGGFVIAAGVFFGLVRFFGEVPPGQNLEAAIGALAFGAVIAAPGLLALLARRDRPALLLPAAIVLVPLSFLSFSLVTLPLLIPAFLLLRAGARATSGGSCGRVAANTVVVLVLLVAALVVLFAHQDPREFETATASYGTSDVVTYLEAGLSLVLTAMAAGAGWWTAPRTPLSAAFPS